MGGSMSERDDLLGSIAQTIKTYRKGEIEEPSAGHVERWVSQFTPKNQLPFLREFNHVIGKTFLTQEIADGFIQALMTNASLAGTDPRAFWSKANLLNIQQDGQSQKEMVKVYTRILFKTFNLDASQCGAEDGDYLYLDDVVFSGSRARHDLERWIREDAPPECNLHIVVVALHLYGSYTLSQNLNKAIHDSGKKITLKIWRAVPVENRRTYRNESSVLWPAVIPVSPEVTAYMALDTRFPLEPRQVIAKVTSPFSSEEGRQVLENEFFIAGARIRAKAANPKPSIRPLGFSSFGVGFGALIVTYRNCPNNCPLALWWGNPDATEGALNWYPLLPRKTYSSLENILSKFDDF